MLTKTYFRRKLAQACGLGLVLCAAAACAPQQNVLTKEEIADGWQLLFDGKTLDQWKDYNGEELTMPWHVVDAYPLGKNQTILYHSVTAMGYRRCNDVYSSEYKCYQ